jgi:hypothetical protein
VGNFSMYDKIIPSDGKGNFSTKMTVTIPKYGDYLNRLCLVVDIPEINITKNISTFSKISSILNNYNINWDYSPEKSDGVASLSAYNGATINISLKDSQTITTSTMSSGDTQIILQSGYILVGSTNMKISSGTLLLSSQITDTYPQNLTVEKCNIYLFDSVNIGNVLPIVSGGNLTIINNKTISSLQLQANFSNTIVVAINNKLQQLLNRYNFFINLSIATRNSDYLIGRTTMIFDSDNTNNSTIINNIKNQLTTGRNLLMYMFSALMLTYNSDYNLLNSTTEYSYDGLKSGQIFSLPLINNNYTIIDNNNSYKTIQLYNSEFKNKLLSYGIMLSILQNYSYDTQIFNCDGDNIENNIDQSISSPIFGNILTRPNGTTQDNLIKFYLYTADDIKSLYYITFLYNIVRLKVVSLSDNLEPFNPEYSTIVNNSTIGVSNENLSYLDPNISSISSLVIFYHALDPIIANYTVFQYNIGQGTITYFNTNIENIYTIFNNYTKNISVSNNYQNTDSYKIYQLYIQNTINNDITNNIINSTQQVQNIANIIEYNIDGNIRYNYGQVQNNIIIINNAKRTKSNHYNLGFYKLFSFDNNKYSPIGGSSFTSLIGNTNILLNDYFTTIINSNISLTIPNGSKIEQMYNNQIQTKINSFTTQCKTYLNNLNTYFEDYLLWERLLITNTSPIYSAYLIANEYCTNINNYSFPLPDITVFNKIAYMNYLPLLVAKDIPKLVYDIFFIYAKIIINDIVPDISDLDINNFLILMDMRDSDDGTNVNSSSKTIMTKSQIYFEIINSIFVTSYDEGNTYVIDNSTFYAQLKNLKSSYSITTCSLRPEQLFTEYSTQDENGNLINTGDNKYLCLEWVTQTFYQIFNNIITTFFANYTNIDTTIITSTLIGLLQNIINSFILRSDLPIYSNYIKNGYLLLGLNSETNSFYGKYQIVSQISTSSSYSDLMSSIWYRTQKGFIQSYNSLFNDILLSYNYFTNYLGSSMGEIFNYIKNKFLTMNTYYENNNTNYDYYLPQSLIDSFKFIYFDNSTTSTQVLNYIGEIYPGVDTNNGSVGFDFYKFNSSTQNFNDIYQFIDDYYSLYSYIFSNYNTYKSITLIKNDNDNIYATSSTSTLNKKYYIYEQSSIINQYLKNHIDVKYVSTVNSAISVYLNNLNINTEEYWNVDKPPNGIHGVLDVIYNQNITGNIINIFNSITAENILTNPFTSFCLYNWFLTIKNFNLSYQNFSNAVGLFNSLIFNNGEKKITSEVLYDNINLKKLYSDTSFKIFPTFEYVIWFLFDYFSNLNIYFNIKSITQYLVSTISGNFNKNIFLNTSSNYVDYNALDTLQNFITSFINPSINTILNNMLSITTITSSILSQVNGVNQYINYNGNGNGNSDIAFYVISPSGSPIIGTNLESTILNALQYDKPKFAWVRELGHKIAKKISIYVGDELIETYTPNLMHLQYQMTMSTNHQRGYNILIGNTKDMYTLSHKQRPMKKLYIVLNFWFCKNVGNSLPLINLMYSDLKLNIDINDLSELLYTDSDVVFSKKPKLKCSLLGTFVYIDDDERMRIANSKLEYLIEKYNYNGMSTFSQSNIFIDGIPLNSVEDSEILLNPPSISIPINLNDPIKYFIWYIKFIDTTTQKSTDIIDWCDYGYNVRNTDGSLNNIKNIISSIKLNMNGITRENSHCELFYTHLVPQSRYMSSLNNGEYVYSFALYPLTFQPTGSANYSEISNSNLIITFQNQILTLLKNNSNLKVQIELWGQSINILRCVSGMAGLAFTKP